MKIVALILSTLLLAACGGGGGGSSSPSSAATPEQLALMVDSLGRAVPEIEFGGGDSGAAGADGSAGDGKPIPNAKVTLVDNAGHTASATTDSLGYYRVNVKGFTPPFIAKVVRVDGSAWYSPSITPVKVRGFVTVNLTGLTDKLASDLATATKVSGGAAQLTTTTLAANTAALQTAKTNLNAQLTAQITAAGLSPATFDPVTTPYKAVAADSYDKLLETVTVVKDTNGVTTVIPKFSLGGSISGLSNFTGLSLVNGAETIQVAANASVFSFATLIGQNASYSVTIGSQPVGRVCTVSSGTGTMGAASVNSVVVTCVSPPSHSVGGNVVGLASGATGEYKVGYSYTFGTVTTTCTPSTCYLGPVAVPAADRFQVWNPFGGTPEGASYSFVVTLQPTGKTCSVQNGTGVMGTVNVTNVNLICN